MKQAFFEMSINGRIYIEYGLSLILDKRRGHVVISYRITIITFLTLLIYFFYSHSNLQYEHYSCYCQHRVAGEHNSVLCMVLQVLEGV